VPSAPTTVVPTAPTPCRLIVSVEPGSPVPLRTSVGSPVVAVPVPVVVARLIPVMTGEAAG